VCCNAECHNNECRNAECHKAECHNTECQCIECPYGKCSFEEVIILNAMAPKYQILTEPEAKFTSNDLFLNDSTHVAKSRYNKVCLCS
jgi:hypothetical protein